MSRQDRVRNTTSSDVNRKIRLETERRIEALRKNPADIAERLEVVDAEWDIERMLGLTSAAVSLLGLSLRRRWLLLPLAVQVFNVQHALQGWCPPLPLFRRLGYRTQQEIERERYTLRTMIREDVGDEHSQRVAESIRERSAVHGEALPGN